MPLKARPRRRDRAADSATETPLETRRDFCRRRTVLQTPSRAQARARGSTEWRCRPHPSHGCSFADRQPQPSADLNHEWTRIDTNTFEKPRIARMRRIWGAHSLPVRVRAPSRAGFGALAETNLSFGFAGVESLNRIAENNYGSHG